MPRTKTLAVRLTEKDAKRIEDFAKRMRWTISSTLQYICNHFMTSTLNGTRL